MGFGDTAKKLQKVADMAEDVYRKLNELREQVVETKETVEETKDRVDSLEADTAEQRALLEALAEQQGVDIDDVIAEAHIAEAEADGENETDAGESSDTSAGESGDAADASDDSDTSQQASADSSN
jgi:predicted Rossmann fold nucleotide-binding protein DprA/Smf involved in DNA uptake